MNNKRFKTVLICYTVIIFSELFHIWKDISKESMFDLWSRIITVILALIVLWLIQKSRKTPN
jgi:hypothetical protein